MKTPVTEHPILFSGPMVKAILEGRKTQTRRVCKPQQLLECPYGKPGMRLWVRETWNYTRELTAPEAEKQTEILRAFQAGEIAAENIARAALELPIGTGERKAIYAADFGDWAYDPYSGLHWRPSIHMPRWASRLTLEIMSVRAERLQQISDKDARAEGMESCAPADQFRVLWGKINGKRPRCSWADDPWVWVINFRRTA